jgi:hypothetical protein
MISLGLLKVRQTEYWYILFTISALTFHVGYWLFSIHYRYVGIGAWGSNNGVDWAWDITNFVWWIGIGHAGTLISAVLLLFRQKWRMAINRSAEAMTIFAVLCAAIFVIVTHWSSLVRLYVIPVTKSIWFFVA